MECVPRNCCSTTISARRKSALMATSSVRTVCRVSTKRRRNVAMEVVATDRIAMTMVSVSKDVTAATASRANSAMQQLSNSRLPTNSNNRRIR